MAKLQVVTWPYETGCMPQFGVRFAQVASCNLAPFSSVSSPHRPIPLVVADRADCGLRVELIRVIEHSRFRSASRRPVVVARDRMEELGHHRGIEVTRPFLDHPEPQVDVTEQSPLLGLAERRPSTELTDSSDVVEQSGREQQIGAQSRMELGSLATQGRDPDGVLEETACVAVVAVRAGCGKSAERGADLGVLHE